jgi:hypothetical protein
MAALPSGHVAALAVVDCWLRDARSPWWVIAGAAVALHARLPMAVDDIDILLAVDDVPLIADIPGVVRQEGAADPLFRSDFYASVGAAGVTIKCMAGFRSKRDGVWSEIWPRTRMTVPIGGLSVPIPDRAETIDMLTAFGRPKDLQRVALLME